VKLLQRVKDWMQLRRWDRFDSAEARRASLKSEPLPCPFCGSVNIEVSSYVGWAKCLDCEAEGPPTEDGDTTEPAIVAAWNRRR
jgi:Lar family restriction alleviation protein